MKKKLLTLFVLFLILQFGFVYAQEETLDYVRQNDCITWKQVYANATYTNFSDVKLPNGTTIVFSPELTSTKSGITFYSEQCNYTSLMGTYHLCGHTDVDGIDTSWCYDYKVTPTGISQTSAQGMGSFGFLILMLGLTVLMGYIGFKFVESDYLWVVGIFFIFLTILFIVYDVWLGYEYHRVLTGMDSESKIPETLFYIFLTILCISFSVTGILLFTKWKKLKAWFKEGIEEQKREDEEDDRYWR